MQSSKIIGKLIDLEKDIGLPSGKEAEIRILDVKAKEYALQEKSLAEIINNEIIDLMETVTTKKARIEALEEMLSAASVKKAEALERKAKLTTGACLP